MEKKLGLKSTFCVSRWNRPLLDDMTHEADRRQAKEERLMNDINNLHSQVADGKKVIKKMKKKLAKVKGNLATTMEESAQRRETTRTVSEQRDALFNVATQLVRTIKDLQDTKPNEQTLVNLPQSGEVGLVDVCLLLKYIQMILECNGIKGLDQSEEARLHTAVSRTAVLVDDALAYAQSKTQANENSPPAASGSSEKPPVKDFDELEARSFFTGLAVPSEPQLENETKSDDSSNPVVTKDVKGSDSPSEENMEGDENDSSEVTAPKDPDRSSVKIWFDLTCCGWNVCWY